MVQALTQALAQTAGGLAAPTTRGRSYTSRRRAMHATMLAAMPFFFAASLARRLNPFGHPAPSHSSIFAETRSRAAAIIPFIFMG